MSQRYQKEIEEILEQVGASPASTSRGKSPLKKGPEKGDDYGERARRRGVRGWRMSPGRLMLTGVALLMAALVLRTAVPGLAGPVAWAGVGLFIIAYVLFFVNPRPRVEKRWRGQLLENPSSATPLWQHIQRWLGLK